MAAIIAPGICRYAVNGQYSGHDVVNILDIQIDTTGSLVDRDDACHDMAGIVLNEWDDHILTHLVSAYTAHSVSWIDLDAADGSTGERSVTDAHTWPVNGDDASAGAPGNVSARVNKNTVARRGQRQGRMYLCGMPEAWTSGAEPNQLNSGSLTGANSMLEDFFGNLNQDGSGGLLGDAQAHLVVIHTIEGAFDDFSVVTSLTMDQFTSSQVRRIRR